MNTAEEVFERLRYRIEVNDYGTRFYYNCEGQLHREDGPAVIYANGTCFWYVNGLLHRLNAPAGIYASGTEEWWQHGQLHREDGPAVVFPDGGCSWYIHGIRKTETEVRLLSQTTTAGQPPFTK